MKLKTYLITGVEPMLYKNFKAACAHYEMTEKDILIQHMRNIVEDYLKAISLNEGFKAYTKKGGKKN